MLNCCYKVVTTKLYIIEKKISFEIYFKKKLFYFI